MIAVVVLVFGFMKSLHYGNIIQKRHRVEIHLRSFLQILLNRGNGNGDQGISLPPIDLKYNSYFSSDSQQWLSAHTDMWPLTFLNLGSPWWCVLCCPDGCTALCGILVWRSVTSRMEWDEHKGTTEWKKSCSLEMPHWSLYNIMKTMLSDNWFKMCPGRQAINHCGLWRCHMPEGSSKMTRKWHPFDTHV